MNKGELGSEGWGYEWEGRARYGAVYRFPFSQR